MALTTAVITVSPHLLCSGTPAVVGDHVTIVVDPAQFEDAEDIVGEITSTEEVTTSVRGCQTQLTCGIAYTIEFNDSLLPTGLSELLNCHVLSIRCADCCSQWKRTELVKVVLQPDDVLATEYYTQIRIPEDWDVWGVAFWIDSWNSAYGEPDPITDLTAHLMVSDVGGNSATTDIAGTEATILRATPETYKKASLAAPVRIDAGRQLWVHVTANGGNAPAVGLGVAIYFRLASDS